MTATKTKTQKKYDGPTVEEKLCERMIELIESGVNPWRKEWKGQKYSGHINLITGNAYHGGNPMMLEWQAALAGYITPLWAGIGQAKQKKWFPRKGSQGCYILRPQLNCYDKKDGQGNVEKDPNGDPLKVAWVSYKTSCVFNVEALQGEGLQEAIDKYMNDGVEGLSGEQRIDLAEQALNAYGKREEIPFRFAGGRAFYQPVEDQITLPEFEKFATPEAFYATLAHECIHSTGHEKRLKRSFGMQGGGEESKMRYAREELVAEMGAFILCTRMEISSNTENHAAYLEGWLKVLKQGPKTLFKVISDSTKAANFILPELSENVSTSDP
jgi:antirestriction protein ArdC